MRDAVTCAAAREAASARIDGEPSDVPWAQVEAHLRRCTSCRQWQDEAAQLSAHLTRAPARPVSDLSARVRLRSRRNPAHPAGDWPLTRRLLLGLGIAQLLHAPFVLFSAGGGDGLHVMREIGITDVALAIGVLAAAWQPWRAAGMLPVIVILAAGQFAVSVIDIADGRVSAIEESPHLIAVLDAVLLMWLRRRTPRSPDHTLSEPASERATPVDGEFRAHLQAVRDDHRNTA